jgi:hypothetical protein
MFHFEAALGLLRRFYPLFLTVLLLAGPACLKAVAAPGAGEGGYTLTSAPSSLVNNTGGNTLTLNFTTGLTTFAATGGYINICVPEGFSAPNSNNFFLDPYKASQYQVNSWYSGLTLSVNLVNVPNGTSLVFYYGYTPGGFYVNTPTAQAGFSVQSVADGLSTDAVSVGGQPVFSLTLPTPTITPTLTVTSTISPTFSVSPTFTATPTITLTWTNTPVGPEIPTGAYTYPNPFDLRIFDKVTLRFPPDTGVAINIFNLAGEPVARIQQGNMNLNEGWAIWDGRDDYGRKVAGGIYFYRIRGDARKWTGKFIVVY